MSALRLKISENHTVQLKLPWGVGTKPSTKLDRLLNFIPTFGWAIVLAAVVLLPLHFQWLKPAGAELPFLFMGLVFVLIIAILAIIVLSGWRYLVDPPLFINVLVFALLVVGGYLFVPLVDPSSVGQVSGSNTFGITGVKYLGGLFVMGFVMLFYALHMFVTTNARFSTLAQAFALSVVLAMIVLAFDASLTTTVATVSMVAFPFGLLYSLYGSGRWLAALSLVASVFAAAFIALNAANLAFMLIPFLVLITTVFGLLAINNWVLRAPELNLRKGLINAIQTNALFVLLLVIGLWFATSVVWLLSNSAGLNQYLQGMGNAFQAVFAQLDQIGLLLIGVGATKTPAVTTLLSIILYQGLVGLLAYLLLGVSSLVALRRAISYEHSNPREIKYSVALGSVVIIVPLLALFTIVDMYLVILWWLSFALLCIRPLLNSLPEHLLASRNLNIFKLKLGSKLRWIQLIILLILLVGLFYLLPALRDQVLRV